MNQLGADMFIGETYLSMREYGKAKQLFQYVVDSLKKSKDPFLPFLTRGLINVGKACAGAQNYKDALKYTKEGFKIIRYFTDPQFVMETYKLLSVVYHHLGNNDSAYFYLNKYTTLKDSAQNKQFLWRLNSKLNKYKQVAENAKRESQIALLNKDNKIKQQQLKQQATFRNFIIAAFIALLFAGLYVFRNVKIKRKNERLIQEQKEQEWKLKELASQNKHVELQKQSAELEMQALRAQMNPHFIFNSLSSINHFILKNESKTASNYLTRFSRLIRMVLMNSQRKLIPLEDELEMLRLYLDMERLRFKNAFDYSIATTNAVESGGIFIPPLLLQPFCENAVWHGLMNKEGQGHLNISISEENKVLNCIITDDGVGRKMAAALKSKSVKKERSLGLQITTKRLSLMNDENSPAAFYEIEDLHDEHGNVAGTKVTLKISYKEPVEEIV